MNSWIESDKEFVKSTGYYVFADVLRVNKTISTKDIKEQLSIIETKIHTESNRVKHTMNNALIAIGIFRPEFQEQVLIIAKKIGRVEVDHGLTSCKTPDATDYILRTIIRNKSRKK
jgi:3-methyladenine DNA glycosylase AlkD